MQQREQNKHKKNNQTITVVATSSKCIFVSLCLHRLAERTRRYDIVRVANLVGRRDVSRFLTNAHELVNWRRAKQQ